MRPNRLRFLNFALLLAVPCVHAQVTLNTTPTQVIGQDSLTVSGFAPNLVEGRELSGPLGVAVDISASPPHLYVADTGNSRVLGWRDATSFMNGQKADVVIGQPDFVTTYAEGPGRAPNNRSTGLAVPVGLAVDASGNLYVADCGNNRVLRFPAPFNQTSIYPDIVIGQQTFTTNAPNLNGIGPSTLNFNPSGSPFTAYLALDANGDLWVADPGNNRVLRFPASSLQSGLSGASADVVLGQVDFVSSMVTGYTSGSLTQLYVPTGLAFDSKGNLFVSESFSQPPTPTSRPRVLVFSNPLTNNQSAVRIIGNPSVPPSTIVNNDQLGIAPGGIGVANDMLIVADTNDNRLLVYPPVSQWTSDLNTQPAASVFGQTNFTSFMPNAGQPAASATSVYAPNDVAFDGTEVFVADTNNNRVIVLPFSGGVLAPATRVAGQDALDLNTVNLIEGREFRFDGLATNDAGLIIDTAANPPHLYVADTYNNRVLCFNDVRKAMAGSKADLVIGQPDFQHSQANYPTNNANTPNPSGLLAPTGLALDASGNLYVADTGNGRVLRFPQPFASSQNMPNADLVLGQPSFTLKITDPSATTMAAPYGLAFSGTNGLFVSDPVHNRVLFFPGSPSTTDFQNGMSATIVIGQSGFFATSAGSSNFSFRNPHHIATDSSGRLYVADSGNSRVQIFDNAAASSSGAEAAFSLGGFNTPQGIIVDQTTGEIWVADTNNSRALRFPAYDQLAINAQSNFTLNEYGPLALAQDASGALYVADTVNRVVIHYVGLAALNAANYLGPCIPNMSCITDRALAPNTIVALYSLSGQATGFFGTMTASASAIPLPTNLADIEVTLNGTPEPLFYVSPTQINFFVGNNAPTSGTATVQVVQVSTGQVLGSTIFEMAAESPALFTADGSGSGQVAAINQDGTPNGPSNPAAWGSVVSLYGTGIGTLSNAPPDGTPAGGPLSTSTTPQVVIGTGFVPAANIQYSGLAPSLVGVWQINVQIPNTVAPTTSTAPTPVIVIFNSVPSGGPVYSRPVTMWVKSS